MPPLAFQNHCGVLQGKENLCFAFRDFGKLISEMSNLGGKWWKPTLLQLTQFWVFPWTRKSNLNQMCSRCSPNSTQSVRKVGNFNSTFSTWNHTFQRNASWSLMSPDKDTCGLAWTGPKTQNPRKCFNLSIRLCQPTVRSLRWRSRRCRCKNGCLCLFVCVSQSCKSYNPRNETACIMLFWLNMDCGCLFCLFQAGFVMFCGLGSHLDWPGSSLILCVLFQLSSSQNPQSTRFCHEIRVAIPEMQSTKPEMHMK